ncbi:MAG TPA: cupin domain-containing protein [Cyclobacteriaceae bacterium]
MTTVNLNELELNEFTARDDSAQHCLATFPLVGAHGSKKLATVYFELQPGERLGSHIDSAEELLVVISGDVEITVGKETVEASAETIALVPEGVPHDIRNIGASRARVLGVFGGANHIIATFENVWLPTHSRIVNTAELFEA